MNLLISTIFLGLAVLFTQIYRQQLMGSRLMDIPNARSMHATPIIRGGGLVFILLGLSSLPLLGYLTQTSWHDYFPLAMAIVAVAGISFADDLYHLSARMRFAVHGFAALLITGFMMPDYLNMGFVVLTHVWWMRIFVFLCILWAINHFNFMDGLDGFCAMQAFFLFSSYAVLFMLYGNTFYQGFCMALSASILGFLFFNFPPAKLFMGDVGSATLGLISFSLALIGQQDHIPLYYWFVLNGLFLFDATITLLRRIAYGEKWSTPHRKHAYQRLRQMGVSVKGILSGQLLINAFFLLGVVLLFTEKFSVITLFSLQIAAILVIYYFVEKKFPMYDRSITP